MHARIHIHTHDTCIHTCLRHIFHFGEDFVVTHSSLSGKRVTTQTKRLIRKNPLYASNMYTWYLTKKSRKFSLFSTRSLDFSFFRTKFNVHKVYAIHKSKSKLLLNEPKMGILLRIPCNPRVYVCGDVKETPRQRKSR